LNPSGFTRQTSQTAAKTLILIKICYPHNN
jgi:hypothetical protein